MAFKSGAKLYVQYSNFTILLLKPIRISSHYKGYSMHIQQYFLLNSSSLSIILSKSHAIKIILKRSYANDTERYVLLSVHRNLSKLHKDNINI